MIEMRKIELDFTYEDYLNATDRVNTASNQQRWLEVVAVINKESWIEIMHSEIKETVKQADEDMK